MQYNCATFKDCQNQLLYPDFTIMYHYDKDILTLSPQNKLLYAKFLICFKIQSALMSLKTGENVVWVSNSLDLG